MSKKTKEELIAIAAEKDKAMNEAHQKFVDATEVARKEYVEAKKRIYPKLYMPSPREQEKTIQSLKDEVLRLKKQLEGD